MSDPLKVLAIHRYYWPDTPPYASLLRSIVRQWTDDGQVVDVLSSQPSYKPELALERRLTLERVDDAVVRRISMSPDRSGRLRRIFNLVAFPLAVGWRVLLGKKYDVVMCSTAPPVVLGAVVGLAARLRGARFVYHCMDLHPEIGALSGEFANPLVRRFLMRLDVATCRRASAVVVLSDDMRRSLIDRDIRLAPRIVVLNNFEIPDFDHQEAVSPLHAHPERVRLAFTGNVGRFQGLDVITDAVLGDDPLLDRIELVFMGEGGAKAGLERRVAEAPLERRGRVRFLPHGTAAEARSLLRTADLGLVSLTPHVIRYAYPSKTATYLSEGVPVLVQVEPDSELAAMVEDEGVGRCLGGDAAAVRATLLDLVRHRESLGEMSANASALWKRRFAAAELLPRWSVLLDDVGRGKIRGAA